MIATNHIERERTPVPQMLYGIYLYYASRSLRLASKILEPIIERSHVSISDCVRTDSGNPSQDT